MSKADKGLMIAAGIAVAVALVVGWPNIRMALLRLKPGVIVDGEHLYDPGSLTYYRISDGAVVYQA